MAKMSLSKKFVSATLSAALFATTAVPAHANPNEANAGILAWLKDQEAGRTDFISKRGQDGGPPPFLDFFIPKKEIKLSPMSPDEMKLAKATKELYDTYFDPNDPSSYVGTWIESGHPYIPKTDYGPMQWNSHKGSNINNRDAFAKMMKHLVELGIKVVRIGPNFHEITENPESWDRILVQTEEDKFFPKSQSEKISFMDKIELMWRSGATPIISFVFFSSLKRWQVLNSKGEIDYDRSFLMNKQFAVDMERDAKNMMERLYARAEKVEKETGKKVRVVINPVNEPETLAGFNRHFWHGAHADFGSPLLMKYYVPSLIQIAKANVTIRKGVEEVAKKENDRVLFMHNEAMTRDYYASHGGFGRFALSKFMLGDKIILETDFDKYLAEPLSKLRSRLTARYDRSVPNHKRDYTNVNEVEWAIREFAFGTWNKTEAEQRAALETIIADFKDLQATHESLKRFNKTMKTDNYLALDYYHQGEWEMSLGGKPVTLDQLVELLAANKGEKLKNIIGTPSDEAFIKSLEQWSAEAEQQELKGVDLSPGKDRFSTDFKKYLSQEDYAMLFKIIGFRYNFTNLKDPDLVKRQTLAGITKMKEEFRRLDIFMNTLLTNNNAGLMKVAGVKDEKSLRAVLKKVALDNRGGGEPLKIDTSKGTIRQILNYKNRIVLQRLLGVSGRLRPSFDPQHYARQARLGVIDGFYKMGMDYVNALRVHVVGVGESGTPFYAFAPLLHDQIMLDYAAILKTGVYGTHYAFGPAVDTIGWGKGPLSKHVIEDNKMEPTGVMRVIVKDGVNQTRLTRWDKNDPWINSFLHHEQFGFFPNLKRYLQQDKRD